MAQKVQVLLEDDLTHEPIPEGEGVTRQFSVEGKTYELDLSEASVEKFDEILAPLVEAGRAVAGNTRRSRRRSGSGKASARNPEVAKIRAWAKENGYDVADRGRIHQEVRQAYEAAQKDEKPAAGSEKDTVKSAPAQKAAKKDEKPSDNEAAKKAA